MKVYKQKVLPGMNKILFTALVNQYTTVYLLGKHVPEKAKEHLQNSLDEAGKKAKEQLLSLFEEDRV